MESVSHHRMLMPTLLNGAAVEKVRNFMFLYVHNNNDLTCSLYVEPLEAVKLVPLDGTTVNCTTVCMPVRFWDIVGRLKMKGDPYENM